MAKKYEETAALCSRIIGDAKAGKFAPVYLLMGEEPFYPDKACEAILENALAPEERDFNQTVYYGLDTDALTVASKVGVVLESNPLRIDEMDSWIRRYFSDRGLSISPDAAALLAEYAGTDLGKISIETDKMLKNLPEGTTSVGIQDIENNIGITRQWTIFELTKVLSSHDTAKALKIASRYSQTPKFAMAAATPMLFNHFQRILKLHAYLLRNPRASQQDKAAFIGVNPYFMREYDMALTVYPLRKCQTIVSMIEDYDYMGKGGDGAIASQEDLFMELVSKILAV